MTLLDTAAPVRPAPPPLPAASDVGMLGVYQLKRMWSRSLAARQGRHIAASLHDRHLDFLVIHAVGLGLEQTAEYLGRHAPTFDEFERWIVETTGGIEPARVARINAAVTGSACPDETARWLAAVDASEPVLSEDDLAHWEEHGYVVLHDAVPRDSREAATQALWDHLGARADDPDSWYRASDHGIMVQYF